MRYLGEDGFSGSAIFDWEGFGRDSLEKGGFPLGLIVVKHLDFGESSCGEEGLHHVEQIGKHHGIYIINKHTHLISIQVFIVYYLLFYSLCITYDYAAS